MINWQCLTILYFNHLHFVFLGDRPPIKVNSNHKHWKTAKALCFIPQTTSSYATILFCKITTIIFFPYLINFPFNIMWPILQPSNMHSALTISKNLYYWHKITKIFFFNRRFLVCDKKKREVANKNKKTFVRFHHGNDPLRQN